MNNSTLKSLTALLITFVIGYIGIVVIHNIFSNIITSLDNDVKNEYSRYKIGEYIIKEIGEIETNYYKMGIVTKIKSLKPIQEEIFHEIEDIKKAINVLENGGVLESYIKLNLLEASEVTDKIFFRVIDKKKYTFEAIDLLPKLEELNKKIYEMEEIMKIRISSQDTSTNLKEGELFRVKLFFKQLPTLFVRMKENASRLLYDSKKNIDQLEKDIKVEKNYYKKLEYAFTYIVMAIVLILGYISIKQILRKAKELEEITQKAKESEHEALKANQTKSQFLANMSHEIRTPLNAIIGFSNILSNSNLDIQFKEKAAIISKSAKALLNIINDILDISKIESGKFEISNSNFNLRDMLEQIVQLYAVNTEEKDIRFLYTLDQRIPLMVNSDETRLKQVLSNILSNAIKFTPPTGKVYFNIKYLGEEKNHVKVRFTIKDEGIGISLEDQEKVFKPFSQADGTISRKFGGTGLGLSISLNIVKMFGSEIQLISRKDEGSTFYFDLDLKIQDEYIEEQKNHKYDFAICNVIEDPEKIRDHLINTVKHFGRIHHTDEDIESCKKIDLIFCFGDPEFYEKLSRRKKKFACPVVFVGNMDKINQNNIMKPLMDYFLDVPIYGSKIFNIIAEAKSIEKELHIENLENGKRFDGKILVAEDNTNNQLLIKLILEEIGLDVTIVENGQLAVEEYQNNDFDLVFMDINMPVMDGLKALKEIRKHESSHNKYTPVIALTANAIKGDKEKYLNKGMDNYISKPIENNELLKVLNLYLNKSTKSIEIKKDKKMIPKKSNDTISMKTICDKLGVSETIAKMVVNKFKSNIHKDLDEFEELINSDDKEAISQKAHYIKNTCLNVCLNEVCSLLFELEKANELEQKDIKHKFKIIKTIIESTLNGKD